MTKLNRAGHKHKRNEGTKAVKPANYLIVTEGTLKPRLIILRI